MPIESGNAALLVDAYGAQQRANTERGAALSSGIQQVGGAIAGARKKMDENTAKEHAKAYIKSLGGNPDAVDGGLESTKAEILRLHQATDAATQEKAKVVAMQHDVAMQGMADTAATGRQTAQFAHSDQQQGIGPGGQYNPENDPAVGRSSAEADLTEGRRQEMAKALGGQVGELTAPVDDGQFTGMLGQLPPGQAPIPMTRDAGAQDVVDRNAASPGKYGIDAVNAAKALMPQAPPPARPRDPALDDLSAAQAEEARARAASLRNPPAKAPRKWEPASEDEAVRFYNLTHPQKTGKDARPGVANKDEIDRILGVLTPEERMEFDDAGKGTDPNRGNGAFLARRQELFKIAVERAGRKMPFTDGAQQPAAPAAGVDPALKAEFDGFPPERQQSLLQQMSPEEKAKIGR